MNGRATEQLGKKVNKSRLKFALSLFSACVTILINGDEDISRSVSAWVFPLMLVAGGMVTYLDSKTRPQEYAAAVTSQCEHSMNI